MIGNFTIYQDNLQDQVNADHHPLMPNFSFCTFFNKIALVCLNIIFGSLIQIN